MDEGREELPQSFDLPEAQPTALAGKVLTAPKPRRSFLQRALLTAGGVLGALGVGIPAGIAIGKAVEPTVGPLIDKDLGIYGKEPPPPKVTETPIPHPDLPNPR